MRASLRENRTKISAGVRRLYQSDLLRGTHRDDVRKLLSVLDRLVVAGNTVLVIEHNLDVIKTADYVIDLGPEGGARGGEVIAAGTPEDVARVANSYTGQFLAPFGPEVDDPVRGLDDVEVVLDDEQAVAGLQELPEGRQQLRDVVEVQPGRRFVENVEQTLAAVR